MCSISRIHYQKSASLTVENNEQNELEMNCYQLISYEECTIENEIMLLPYDTSITLDNFGRSIGFVKKFIKKSYDSCIDSRIRRK